MPRAMDIDVKSGNYGTALGAAAYYGHERIVQLLLDRGADINAEGGNYGTALGAAASRGSEEIDKTDSCLQMGWRGELWFNSLGFLYLTMNSLRMLPVINPVISGKT